ncbi:hypothetical protein LVJ83_03905 [Uruburuella testudinis]|uniref:Uncharacterized protein n=1 Tax=Uruburuella testudinis TaxID=1282863 RepID=A0ABY4DX16_9NEIS|nr:hypothetical protein [Uruburuella testudinis]UOO82614.1 hypothetical protein LVJ83_03905 [Uruburuella testudinis]
MRGFLPLEMQMPSKKRSKVEHLARFTETVDAFSEAKTTHQSNGQDI